MSVLEQNVLRLYVAMHYAATVCVLQCVGCLARDADRVAHRELLLAFKARAQRLTIYIRHHVVQQSVSASRVKQRQNMWMLQIRGELDLLEKAVGAQHRRQLCVQNLYGNFTVMLDVLGEIYRGHTARAELALDRVPVSKGAAQRVERIGSGR